MNTFINEANTEAHYNEVCRTYRLFLEGGGDIGSREHTAYLVSVADAVEYFGGEDNAPAWCDMDFFEFFSDVYKADMNFRPRGWTLGAAKAWLDARPEFGYGDDGEVEADADTVADYTQPHEGAKLNTWLQELL